MLELQRIGRLLSPLDGGLCERVVGGLSGGEGFGSGEDPYWCVLSNTAF